MPNRSGFISIAATLAMTAVVLAVTTVSIQRAASHSQSNSRGLTVQEGFYGSEIAIQNAYWKGMWDAANPSAAAQGGAQPEAMASFQHSYGTPSFSSNYSAGSYLPGVAINLRGTMTLDPGRILLRKATGSNIKFLPVERDESDSSQVATGMQKICGRMEFSNLNYRTSQCGYAEFAADTSFPHTPWSRQNGFDGPVHIVLPLTDGSGRMYVGGQFRHFKGTFAPGLVRLNANGSLDASFIPGQGFNYSVIFDIAFMQDGSGRIYVGGSFTTYQGVAARGIIRLNSDGSRDNSFVVGAGFAGTVTDLLVIDNGTGEKLLAAGSFFTYKGVNARFWARLDTFGNLDAGWNPAQIPNNLIEDLERDASGTVYMVGVFTDWGGVNHNRIVAIDPLTGVPVAGFNGGGGPGTGFDAAGNPRDMAIDALNRIWVTGNFNTYNGVASDGAVRLFSNGARDAGFNVMSIDFEPSELELLPGGDVVIAGRFWLVNTQPSKFIVRLDPTGAIRAGWNVGTSFDNDSGGYVYALAIAQDGTNDIIAGGNFSSYQNVGMGKLARLRMDGSVVNTFNRGSAFDHHVLTMEIASTSSGTIYVGGYFSTFDGASYNQIMRLRADGTADPTFNIGTGFTDPAAAALGRGSVFKIVKAEGGTGDIYVGGYFNYYNGVAAHHLVRLHSTGFRDLTFNVPAGTFTRFAGTPSVQDIAPLNDGSGRIYVAGTFDTYAGVASRGIIRVNADGSVDNTFNAGGGVSVNGMVNTVVLAPDGTGDIYLGGGFSSYRGVTTRNIVRVDATGNVVAGFDTGGGAGGFDGGVRVILPSKEDVGDIYVGGSFSTYKGAPAVRLVRLTQTGDIDPGFNMGTGIIDLFGAVNVLVDGPNVGEVYVGGNFTGYNGTNSYAFVGVQGDGTLVRANTGMGGLVGGGPGVVVWSALKLPGGDYFLGGDIPFYSNITTDHILRLHIDDSIN